MAHGGAHLKQVLITIDKQIYISYTKLFGEYQSRSLDFKANTNKSIPDNYSNKSKHKQMTNNQILTQLCSCGQDMTLASAHLLIEVHWLEHFECLVVVTEQWVQTKETHKAEVAEHLVERPTTKVTCYTVRITWTGSNNKWLTISTTTTSSGLYINPLYQLQRCRLPHFWK